MRRDRSGRTASPRRPLDRLSYRVEEGYYWMSADSTNWQVELDRDGVIVLRDVYSSGDIATILSSLDQLFDARPAGDASIRGAEGIVYAARNMLQLWPPAAAIWRRAALTERLSQVLGAAFGLVRILFFDKP